MTTADGRLLLGALRSEAPLETLTTSAVPGGWLAFSSDGGQIAFVDRDGDVKTWLLAERQAASTVPRHVPAADWPFAKADFWRARIRPEFLKKKRLAILHEDGALGVWDGAEPREREIRSARSYGPRPQLAVSPDKTTIAVNDAAGQIVLFDCRKPGAILARIANTLPAQALSFAPLRKELAIGCGSGVIRIVNIATGIERVSLVGHRFPVNALTFSPDGLTLVSAGADGSARLWDMETGQELAILESRSGPLTSLAFSADGRALAVAGAPHEDGTTVSVYDAGPSLDQNIQASMPDPRQVNRAANVQVLNSGVPKKSRQGMQ